MGISSKKKRCQKCRNRVAVRRTMEIIDRFDIRYVSVCVPCAKKIETENLQFRN